MLERSNSSGILGGWACSWLVDLQGPPDNGVPMRWAYQAAWGARVYKGLLVWVCIEE